MQTQQEHAWATEFGDTYHARNATYQPIKLRRFFQTALRRAERSAIANVIEFGAGDGRNLLAIDDGLRNADTLTGVELNETAYNRLEANVGGDEFGGHHLRASILDDFIVARYDLVLTKGTLIHIAPEDLGRAYATLCGIGSRYILVCEYYAPRPEQVVYQGETELCWRGDFAAGLINYDATLSLTDYGFAYHGDPAFDEDDVMFFLLER